MGKGFKVSSMKKIRKEGNELKKKRSIGTDNAADDPEADCNPCG
jgi:hypothetical protein